jgi:GT2 family glycosyltransferase
LKSVPNDQLQGDTWLPLQQRASLLRVLNLGVRSAAGTAATRSLRRVRDALRADKLDIALRELDRAWRSLPGDAATLAPIYGRLLLLEATDEEAALHLLRRAMEFTPDPDVAALIALALLRLQRLDEAQRQLKAALAQYGVAPDGLLLKIAGELMQHAAIKIPGWVGRGPHLELVGALNADESSSALDIRLDGQAPFTQLLRNAGGEGRRTFSLQLPQLRFNTTVEVSCRGVPLLGSGARIPPDFALDARAGSGRCVTGWVRVGWLPTRPVRLRFEDENGHCGTAMTSRAAQPGWRWPFQLDRRAARLRGSRIQIFAQRPDGGWQPLPDSPLLLGPAVRLAGRKPVRLPAWRARPSRVRGQGHVKRAKFTDVIIPVYRGREETLACIDAVLTTIDHAVRVVVVDDATEDPLLAGALDALAAAGRITLLRNPHNQGFAAAVNRGLALNPTHDAVLLNSDTRVFDDWLMRLRRAAYAAPHVGTVTPLSNSGSIASYPRALSDAIDPATGAALHALAAATHPGTSLEIPVGVGFCLYVRRDCLRDVGALDAGVFGQGYGEETDFCLRARRRGWSHRLAADVFVYHAGGLSFAGRRAALLARSQRLINLRHPGYDRFIASFLAQDPLQPLRRQLDERRLSGFEGRFVLLVTLALPGGVDRFVAERCRNLRAQGLFPLLLRPAAGGSLRRCELWTDAIEVPNLRYDIPADLSALTAVLRAVRLHAIEIQHFLHLDARVIDAVRSLPLPVVPTPRSSRAAGRVIRIALIGAIGEHKGYRFLLDCARDARARRLPIEFVVIGYTQDDAALLKTGKVFITGRYGEAEVPHLLRREQPEIVWLPSVWPESWSYTLDYALAAGLPVLAFDLGAIAERLRAVAGGVLISLALDARRINDQLLQLAQDRRLAGVKTRDDSNIIRGQSDEMHMNNPSEAKPKPTAQESNPQVQEAGLSASVQGLPLPPGLYLFSVTSADLLPARTSGQLSLPAVQVGLGPGVRPEQVEFMAGPSTHGTWLFAPGDLLVAKVSGAGVTLLLTSLRAPGGQVLAIKVERLDARADAIAPTAGAALPATDDGKAPAKTAGKSSTLPAGAVPVQIGAHIRSRGDMIFADVPWAGRVAPGLWMESFSIRPLERFGAQDIEYKGLTGVGFETPWVSEEKMCGTKGMAVPLVGFAIRLKPSAAAAVYDCEYSGYFQSGLTVGPLRNGAPCRSTVANDALEGIQVHVVKRSARPPPTRRP